MFQQKGWLPKPNITINQILRIDRDIGSFRTTPEIEKKYNDQLHPDLNEWLENRLKERIEKTPDLSKIPEANLKAVLEYTMGFGGVNYQHMNTALRNGNRTELAKYEPYIFNLISALNQFPVFEGPVYRSIKASYTKSIERYLVNKTIIENSFISTTTDETRAFSGNVQFVITNGGPDIGLLSCAPHEKEVLICPGTKFLVADIQHGDGNNLHGVSPETMSHLTITLTRL